MLISDKSGEKIYIYNPSIELTRDGKIIGVSRMTGRIASECRYEYKETDFHINQGITKEISQYPLANKTPIEVFMWVSTLQSRITENNII